MTELLPGFEVAQWWGILVPAAVPKDIVTRLHSEITTAVRNAKVSQALVKLGTQPLTNTPALLWGRALVAASNLGRSNARAFRRSHCG
jgi:tripartite-type tricarboxylate transporter receptor subunit TctC